MRRVIYRLRALWRPLVTFGVRLVVIDGNNRVLLVRHTYMPGWHCPGGGVDPGETAREAALRETREETGLFVPDATFFALYFNEGLERRDHVAVFVARPARVDAAALRVARAEIAEAIMAPLDELPEGVSRSTRARLDEIVHGAPPAERW